MDGQVRFTEAEKAQTVLQVRACLAFGGGTLSSDAEQGLRDIMDGKITEDEYYVRWRAKYGKYMDGGTCD